MYAAIGREGELCGQWWSVVLHPLQQVSLNLLVPGCRSSPKGCDGAGMRAGCSRNPRGQKGHEAPLSQPVFGLKIKIKRAFAHGTRGHGDWFVMDRAARALR